MKEKLLKVKEFAGNHKKEIILGVGATVLAIVGGKFLVKKLKAVEIYNEDAAEEIAGGAIDQINAE